MRRLGALLPVALLLVLLSSCGGSKRIEVSARFADVGSLTTQAPVMMNDVRVGNVKGIRLSGNEALVTMSLDPTASVPRNVTARIRRTSLLGEQIVDLVAPPGTPANEPALAQGQVIRETSIRPDLENLVQSGNAVLAPITASEVATLVNEGATAFGGKGEEVRTLLGNMGQIVHAYAARADQIRSVIGSLNQLNTSLASHAGAQGRAVANTQRALDVLRAESGRLQSAIHSLARLSVGARSILSAHAAEMSRFFAQMRTILGVLQQNENSIVTFLRDAPLHNRNTQLVEYLEFNQVVQDFVICGFNNDNADPARRCNH